MQFRIFLAILLTGAIGVSAFAADDLSQPGKVNKDNTARQNREEQIEGVLNGLEKSFMKMLKTQIAVQKGIKDLHITIDGTTEKTPQFRDYQAALNLASSVKQSIKEANRITEMLEKDGAIAFPEVFVQLRDDMKKVQSRLERCDVGPATQALQEDIVETLREMIGALTKGR